MAAASVTGELALRGGAAADPGWQASRPGAPRSPPPISDGAQGGRDAAGTCRAGADHRDWRRKRRVRNLDDPRGTQPGEVAQRLLRDLGRLLAPLLYVACSRHSTSHEIPNIALRLRRGAEPTIPTR